MTLKISAPSSTNARTTRVRIAPSPTGDTSYIGLLNYIFAAIPIIGGLLVSYIVAFSDWQPAPSPTPAAYQRS